MANKFILKHHQVEVAYTIGGNQSLPALTYKDDSGVKSFKPDDIRTEQTSLGSMVSVLLVSSIDAGGERFGFFLPEIALSLDKTEAFMTVGIYDKFSGPDSVPHLPPSLRSIELHGTAETVIVPLDKTTSA